MKAREVIAEYFELEANFGPQGLIEALSQAGFVILPKEPSDEIIEAGASAYWDSDTRFESHEDILVKIYRAMISHAEGEKG